MKAAIFLCICVYTFNGYSQYNDIKNKIWRVNSIITISESNDTTHLFQKDSLNNLDQYKISLRFTTDSTYEGSNFLNQQINGTWTKINQDTIVIENDTSKIVNISGQNVLLIHPYDYYELNNVVKQGIVVTSLIVTETQIESLKSSVWQDPTGWSCQCIPSYMDNVTIKSGHKITLPSESAEYCNRLLLEPGANCEVLSKLLISNTINVGQ